MLIFNPPGAMDDCVIEAKKIDFGYTSDQKLLKSFSLKINRGQFVGVIGPNGSGKTTVFKILTGFLKPESGSVMLDGKNLNCFSSFVRAGMMAVLPQMQSEMPPFSVREIVEMGRISHLNWFQSMGKKDRDAVLDAAEMTGITRLFPRKFNELSGGEKQKVLIAAALAQQSEIIFLDEPTSALDMTGALQIMSCLKNLQINHRRTVVVISHNLELLGNFADRLVLLKKGEIIADGKPENIVCRETVLAAYDCNVQIVRGIRGEALISYELKG